jgi:hypothetical protein
MDKMMRAFVILFLILHSLNLFSQKEANIWHFGDGYCIDFSSGEPVNVNGSEIYTSEGNASYFDKFGNFLFYTNGELLLSSKHISINSSSVKFDLISPQDT